MKVLNSLTLTLCKRVCVCAILKMERESECESKQMIRRARYKWVSDTEMAWVTQGRWESVIERDREMTMCIASIFCEANHQLVRRRCPNAATSCGWHISRSIFITFCLRTHLQPTMRGYVSSNKFPLSLAICLQIMCSSGSVSATHIQESCSSTVP